MNTRMRHLQLNPDTRQSTTGHLFVIGGGPVSFESVTQTLMTHSKVEADFITLSYGT